MAMIKCPECGKDISDSARQCPNCGFELKKEPTVTYVEVKNKPVAHRVGMIMMLLVYIVALGVWVWTAIDASENRLLAFWGIPFQYIAVGICAIGVAVTAFGSFAKDFVKYNSALIGSTVVTVLLTGYSTLLLFWDKIVPGSVASDYQCCFIVYMVFPVGAIAGLIVAWIGMIHAKVK